jgi:hypothetical protein
MAHSSTRPVNPPDQDWTSPADDMPLNTGWVGHHGTALFPAFVGSGSGEVMDAPRPKGDRRLELPFSFEVAA